MPLGKYIDISVSVSLSVSVIEKEKQRQREVYLEDLVHVNIGLLSLVFRVGQ